MRLKDRSSVLRRSLAANRFSGISSILLPDKFNLPKFWSSLKILIGRLFNLFFSKDSSQSFFFIRELTTFYNLLYLHIIQNNIKFIVTGNIYIYNVFRKNLSY